MTPLAYNLLHAALWQGAWWAAVLGAGHGRPWLGPVCALPVLALHAWRYRDGRGWQLVPPAAILVLGVAVDGALAHIAGMRIAAGDGWSAWPQPWMAGLWVLLATALPASLSWLPGRPLVGALAGAVAGPLAYLGGVRFGALALPAGAAPVVAIALAWAVALPAAAAIAGHARPRGAPCPC